MDYETRRLKITLWIVVAILMASIVGVSLFFFLKTHTPTEKPNRVNVGTRIDRSGTFLLKPPGSIVGDNFVDDYTSDGVSYWGGRSYTGWDGDGTSTSPYLITQAGQLAGLSKSVNSGTTYAGKYFKLANDMNMQAPAASGIATLTFTPIGNSSYSFQGNFDGDGHTISNLTLANDSSNYYGGLFGKTSSATIKNFNLEYVFTSDNYGARYFGGVSAYDTRSTISNINVSYSTAINLSFSIWFGGIVGDINQTSITDCQVSELNVQAVERFPKYGVEACIGGVAGGGDGTIANCKAEVNVTNYSGAFDYFGGILGKFYQIDTTIIGCYATGTVTNALYFGVNYGGCSGIADSYGYDGERITIKNCLSQLTADGAMYGIIHGQGDVTVTLQNNIVNSTFTPTKAISNKTYGKTNIFNSSLCSSTDQGATTDVNMKFSSTYADWTDFDTYWVIDEKINNGYPMLKKFIEVAKVTGFEGDGTERSPYLVKTHQDLLGLASYYNDNDLTKAEIYWKLANDINVSRDANNALIHFTPICYAKEFDGYFDGNGKTISGLLIDKQYEYTGLFGTIGANHYVKNLTVKGNIYWDQAYAVGGVAGRVMNGGYLQNCTFNGNIIGVLNTKPSTECNGVVGKYELNGAVDCTATYTDLKYAKIGGTTDAPTYTYYLYDWAQLTTSLYNKKVG